MTENRRSRKMKPGTSTHDSLIYGFSPVFDKSGDFIFIVDRDFKIVDMNKTFLEMFEKTRHQVLGKKCYEIIHGTQAPPAGCPNTKADSWDDSLARQVYGSQSGIQVVVSLLPIFNDIGKPLATFHVGRVVIEKKGKHGCRAHTRLTDDKSAVTSPLTPRQKAVLDYLAQGLSVKEIAHKMAISPRTVEFHKRELMSRLKVNRLAGLIKFAFLDKDTNKD
jgi:DNA-binding CsgD family transcriptional regulator